MGRTGRVSVRYPTAAPPRSPPEAGLCRSRTPAPPLQYDGSPALAPHPPSETSRCTAAAVPRRVGASVRRARGRAIRRRCRTRVSYARRSRAELNGEVHVVGRQPSLKPRSPWESHRRSRSRAHWRVLTKIHSYHPSTMTSNRELLVAELREALEAGKGPWAALAAARLRYNSARRELNAAKKAAVAAERRLRTAMHALDQAGIDPTSVLDGRH